MRAPWLFVLAGLTACKVDSSLYERTATDVFYQEPTDEVDILFIVDNSHSMQQEQQALATGFTSFISEIENTGVDFHLGVITTTFEYTDPDRGSLIGDPPFLTKDDDYLTLFPERVLVGIDGSGREKGIEAASWALSALMTSEGSANEGFLRPEANLLAVFVSDEDDCSDEGALEGEENKACYLNQEKLVPVADYVTEFRDLKEDRNRVRIGAIVGPETDVSCNETVPGTRYIALARYTGGLVGDICDQDWSGILYDLGLNATGINTSFQLSHGARPETLVVRIEDVEVAEGQRDGWTYDELTYVITFHGEAIPPRGSVITVEYTIASGT